MAQNKKIRLNTKIKTIYVNNIRDRFYLLLYNRFYLS